MSTPVAASTPDASNPESSPQTQVSVRGLSVSYRDGEDWIDALREVSLDVAEGEVFGLVGESGCGKSTLALTLLGYRHPRAKIAGGEVRVEGRDLLALPPSTLASLRGRRISFVPQNPTTALNPARQIGDLVVEVLTSHRAAASGEAARRRGRELLAQVGLPEPDATMKRYPHQLSGGQQQRVCIAMALACEPALVVLDEPTTGLDVTTQEQIIDLLAALRLRLRMTMVYVAHDLAVLAQIADRVGVMYAGSMVEVAPVDTLFREPRHPYTRGLIGSVPRLDHDDGVPFAAPLKGLLRRGELGSGCAFARRCDYAEAACEAHMPSLEPAGSGHDVACFRWREIGPPPRLAGDASREVIREPAARPVLELDDVSVAYGPAPTGLAGALRRASPPVVHDVSLRIAEGETFALVGESGSGKSTIARAVSGLLAPRAGRILFRGEAAPSRVAARPQELRRLIQYVFQNPDASLNPRMRIRRILARPLELLGNVAARELDSRVAAALDDVRLDSDYADRFPDQLSGGERQRIAIARALVVDPALLLCDEVLSALDVSVQASILDLLRRLRTRHRVSMLFISHDLAVVRTLADRIGVMYRGRLLETGSNDEVFAPPHHPYTRLLLHAIPGMRARRRAGEAVHGGARAKQRPRATRRRRGLRKPSSGAWVAACSQGAVPDRSRVSARRPLRPGAGPARHCAFAATTRWASYSIERATCSAIRSECRDASEGERTESRSSRSLCPSPGSTRLRSAERRVQSRHYDSRIR